MTPLPAPTLAPDHRHVYILLAGIVVGLLLGPWCMGRFMNETGYERWYLGGGDAIDEYQEFLKSDDYAAKSKELLDRLSATGVTDEALIEMQAKLEADSREQRKPYIDAIVAARRDHESTYRGLMAAIILPVITLMFLEPLFESAGLWGGVRRRLVLGRYVLLAAWIALALAKPRMMSGTVWLLAILAMVLALAVAAAPMLIAKPEEQDLDGKGGGQPENAGDERAEKLS